ncbi:MAG: hypothetical protein WCC59_12735 [Terriglobales bacterium]
MLAIVFLAMVAGLSGCSKKQEQNASTAANAGPSGEISGTVTLSAELKDKVGNAPLLMIVASTSPDPKRPALVVKREAGASFPYQYKLTADDITLVGSTFEGKMYVTARIDPAGMVGPPRPGTFAGSYSGNPVPVGSSKIDIVIDKAY